MTKKEKIMIMQEAYKASVEVGEGVNKYNFIDCRILSAILNKHVNKKAKVRTYYMNREAEQK